MPLPFDEQVLKTSEGLVAQLQAIFGKHPGFRPAHARGVMFTGTFAPTAEAAALSIAPHFKNASTPITVRFSSSTGIPQIPDTDPNANPRGLAIRFNLPEHNGRRVHTDIVVHSTPFFPTRTGAEFLEFLQAIAASPPGTPSPSPVEKFVGSHPSTLAFVQAPKPAPVSFAKEAYYAVTALKFINAEGEATYFRYRILPDAGEENVNEADLKERDGSFLYDELPKRVAQGPVGFTLYAQLAEEGDVTDDATVHWPNSRPLVKLGTLKVEKLVADTEKEQKSIIYDPIARVQGIEPSDDPLLEVRAAVYLISGRQRRAA
ncbi:hypothetical protein FRB94_012209 [Tulasnella sp. JGI-2019a]|nr:hypothetical protein FRB94_012209 [Tulasnella sp. JGI-2019a]KAG9008164.1 hypothetical protein FRB93_006731 [Tulasnella sp. JGI-2019a]